MRKKKPVIEILIIGDEILSDPAHDKNAPFLVDVLSENGFKVDFISYIGDVVENIVDAFRYSVERADIVLVTGGLGPTSDDVTVEAFAGAFDLNLVLEEEVLGRIKEVFRRRGRIMSSSNIKQAMIPFGATPLPNEKGTAPGIYLEVKETDIYLMPGVPREMNEMFCNIILSGIEESYEKSSVETAILNVSGISESKLYDKINKIPGTENNVKYYPGYEGINLKIVTDENSPVNATSLQERIQAELGSLVYSTEGESLEEIVGKLLYKKKLTIAVAESCTGGLIAHRLTNVPGSSNYLLCSAVTYSNESKQRILGVELQLLKEYGAVSAEVAQAMSEGVRRISGADIGVSVTGIAGPGGGSEKKPVGLMYSGISTKDRSETKKLQFVEDRIINKIRMSQEVLDIVRKNLEKE